MRKLASTVATVALAASVIIAPVVTAPAAHAAPGYSCHYRDAYNYGYLRTRDYSYAVQLTRYGWACYAVNY